MSSYSISSRAKALRHLGLVMFLTYSPLVFAQPGSVTFNVNETLRRASGSDYSVAKSGGSVTVTAGASTVTFTAPSGEFTGKELPNSLGGAPAFFLDNAATFTVSAKFSSPDDV